MPSYDSAQFRRDWVYAIDSDFHSPDGTTPATYAEGQPAEWGHEHDKIPLPAEPGAAGLNADESLLAVALDQDIHIYSVADRSLSHVLRGHVSRVDALCFHPRDAAKLVSCAMNHRGGSVIAEPEIVFWDLVKQHKRALLTEDTLRVLGKRAVDGIAEGLEEAAEPWKMDEDDEAALATDVEKAISALNIKSQARTNTRIHGRLVGSFGSQVFNSTGTSLVFLPGNRPNANGDDKWDISIYDTRTHSVRLTLSGHRDAIMWVGFSPNDKLLASVSWDQTFKIWDHDTGHLMHTFRSSGQNWTGAFSPDSRFFAGTSGKGRLWVWDVAHGLEIATHNASKRWCRSVDWSPDGRRLLVGAQGLGRVLEYDLKSQAVVQERVLSTAKSPKILQQMGASFLEVTMVKYLNRGRMVALKACGSDDGVEVFDFVSCRKWRFAPAQGLDRGWAFGGNFVVVEGLGMIASVDADAVRFWKIPFEEGKFD
ncbi:MAG: hypothetical protein ASARMPRED_006787 [Alectoria sarmentosa]|nr:MAG: hypothetical protein ASARMPRED_006787 [Alectoria sarmentosa]